MTQGTKRAFITGIAGFVGKHLARYLASTTDVEISGVDQFGIPDVASELGLGSRLQVMQANLADTKRVREIVEAVQPDWIFHLAAQAFVPTAFADPAGTLVNNIVGQVNILEAALALPTKPIVMVVGSNEEYGMVRPEELPIQETAPFRPINPYAVSKVAQDMLGYQYHVAHSLPVIRVRPFNHMGPGQSERFVASDFAKQIAEIEAGLRPPVIHVGNLEAERDFTDVRDIVRAYHLVVTMGQPGDVYNLGSGRAVSIQHLLDLLLAQSHAPITIERDAARYRPADIPRIVADASKFRSLTGWYAEIPLEKTLADTLAWWRDRVRRG
ncbi:MAG: GDP-mannose 4,6-dehydratase [Chloroflexota bacterium]